MARDRDERENEDEEERPRRRPRPADDEDEDDGYAERRARPQTTNPGSAKAAAILWIILGGLGTILFGLGAVSNPNLWGIVFALVAVAYLITGIQTLVGAVSGIMAAGIFSIILSVILLVFAAGAVFAGAMFAGAGNVNVNGAPVAAPAGALGGIMAAAGLILGLGGLLMLTSGILAIAGSKKYKRWVAYKKGSAKRGRRREYEEDEEEEERPRKKRPRTDDDD